MSRVKLSDYAVFKITHKEQRDAWDTSCEYLQHVHSKHKPYWLTLMGNCGVGKTMLAKALVKACRKRLDAQSWRWSSVVNKYLRNGDFGIVNHLIELDLLLIDDIGAEYASEFSNRELLRVLENRLDKWTIITTNDNLDAISDKIDMRIASRLKRGDNVIVRMFNARDFADC